MIKASYTETKNILSQNKTNCGVQHIKNLITFAIAITKTL